MSILLFYAQTYLIDWMFVKARVMISTRAQNLSPLAKATELDLIQAELADWLKNETSIPINMLLSAAGLNVHRDSPCEILHTYLLGIVRYTWHISHHDFWSPAEFHKFSVRLQACDTNGLTIPAVRASFMEQYKGNLVGKHFRQLSQLGIFAAEGCRTSEKFVLGDELAFDLWKATGELGALLYYHEIQDMEEYLDHLTILIENLLDVWSLIDPGRIVVKGNLYCVLAISAQCSYTHLDFQRENTHPHAHYRRRPTAWRSYWFCVRDL